LFHDNPLAASRDENCRTFRKWKMIALPRANVFSSFENSSVSAAKNLSSFALDEAAARPGIQESQEFAHYIESTAAGAPPVPGIEGIGGSGTPRGRGPGRGQAFARANDAARMSFCT